jgi:hypothetical protein
MGSHSKIIDDGDDVLFWNFIYVGFFYLSDAETETLETDIVTTNSVVMNLTVQIKMEVFRQILIVILMMN